VSYRRGDLKIARSCVHAVCESDDSSICDEDYETIRWVYDSRTPKQGQVRDVAFLPHSCDQWVIGGKEQVRAIIEDLEAAYKELP